jgi:Lysozyme like domain
MSVLTVAETYAYATAAGFTGAARDTIVAIAGAESGYNTQAHNPNDPYGGSWGILQINGAHFASGTTTQQCALDPACAFKYAYGLYQAQGFKPWGTYTSGAYKQYLNNNTSIPTITLSSSDSNTSTTSCAPWDIPCILSQLVSSDIFQRGSIMFVGLILVLIGLVVVIVGEGAKVSSQ